jgi:hypothetical protein
MTTTTLRFAWIHNNGYDTLAIVDGGKVVSAWQMQKSVAQNYLNPGDINDWDLNQPDLDSISDYGDEMDGDDLQERIDFFLR